MKNKKRIQLLDKRIDTITEIMDYKIDKLKQRIIELEVDKCQSSYDEQEETK